jgi:hypothetical protein
VISSSSGFWGRHQLAAFQMIHTGRAGKQTDDAVAQGQAFGGIRFAAQGLLQNFRHKRGIPGGLLFGVDFSENRAQVRISPQKVAQGFIQECVIDAGMDVGAHGSVFKKSWQ